MDAASDSDTDNIRKDSYSNDSFSVQWAAQHRICTSFFAAARIKHGLRCMRC